MKFIRLTFIAGVSFLVPLVTYFMGYHAGQAKEVVVFRDAPRAVVVQEKLIGTVAGTRSAELAYQNQVEKSKSSTEKSTTTAGRSDLWQTVNEYRQNHGLAAFIKDEVLCELVRTRLGELQGRGGLDDHAGFRSRTDHYLNEKGYRKLAENTSQGYTSAVEVLGGWHSSIGHRSLLEATDLDRGCAASGGGFAVLIAGKKI